MISLSRLKTILTMSAVFTLGAIMGASCGILVSRNAASALSLKSRPGIVEKFKTRLKLSPEQAQQIESILDQTHHDFNELHLVVKPQFEEIRQKMRSEIRQILREEQKQDYQAMLRESDERRASGKKQGIH